MILKIGDVVTFEGVYNRPVAYSVAWWKRLIFGRMARFIFSGPHPEMFKCCTRRDLFEPRRLQKYRITADVTA